MQVEVLPEFENKSIIQQTENHEENQISRNSSINFFTPNFPLRKSIKIKEE